MSAGTAAIGALPPELRTWSASPFAWRWRHVDGMCGPLARAARYFCALDECCRRESVLAHPALPLAERERRVAEQARVLGLLVARLRTRAREHAVPGWSAPQVPPGRACAPGEAAPAGERAGGATTGASGEADATARSVRTWSRIQLALAHAHFASPGGGLDLAALEDAYLAFAGGLLRVPVAGRRGIGEPDGAYYFAFAEFALLACEQGIDAEQWEPQLAHLVWTQEVYAHLQRPVGRPPHRFHAYAPRGRERRFDPGLAARAKERVRGLRARAELEALHALHCRETFGDLQGA